MQTERVPAVPLHRLVRGIFKEVLMQTWRRKPATMRGPIPLVPLQSPLRLGARRCTNASPASRAGHPAIFSANATVEPCGRDPRSEISPITKSK